MLLFMSLSSKRRHLFSLFGVMVYNAALRFHTGSKCGVNLNAALL